MKKSLSLVSLLLISAVAHAQGSRPRLVILSATASPDLATLTARGLNFTWAGDDEVIVSFEGDQLDVNGVTESQIEVVLPIGIEPGTYLLHVSRGPGAPQNGTLDVTLGAVGPQGDQGPPGPQGPKGDPGAAGGLSGYEQVVVQELIPGNLGSGSAFSAVAQCPAGKKVLGGGIRLSGMVSVLADLRVFSSEPSSSSAWRGSALTVVSSPPADSVTLTVSAVCAAAN